MIYSILTFGPGTAYDDHPLRLRREDPSKSSATTTFLRRSELKAIPPLHDVTWSVDVLSWMTPNMQDDDGRNPTRLK